MTNTTSPNDHPAGRTQAEAVTEAIGAYHAEDAEHYAAEHDLNGGQWFSDHGDVTWVIDGDGTPPYISVAWGDDLTDPDGYVDYDGQKVTLS